MSSSTQRSLRREQREQTRRQILAAADAFLREHPYRELSLEVVMAETSLTRTAFYRHFDDVTELVLQLLGDVGGSLYAVGLAWRESVTDDFVAAARAGLRGIVDFFVAHGPLVRAVADAAATDEKIELGYGGFVEAFIEMTAAGFDDLVEQGQLEPFDTLQRARALNLMNESYLLDQFGSNRRGDPDAAYATLEAIWLRAIGPLRPRRP